MRIWLITSVVTDSNSNDILKHFKMWTWNNKYENCIAFRTKETTYKNSK